MRWSYTKDIRQIAVGEPSEAQAYHYHNRPAPVLPEKPFKVYCHCVTMPGYKRVTPLYRSTGDQWEVKREYPHSKTPKWRTRAEAQGLVDRWNAGIPIQWGNAGVAYLFYIVDEED